MTVGALAVVKRQYPMGPGGNEPRPGKPRLSMYEAVSWHRTVVTNVVKSKNMATV